MRRECPPRVDSRGFRGGERRSYTGLRVPATCHVQRMVGQVLSTAPNVLRALGMVSHGPGGFRLPFVLCLQAGRQV